MAQADRSQPREHWSWFQKTNLSSNAEASDLPESDQKDYPKLAMLGVLHMAQYFPIAFVSTALPFLFRKEGLPLEMFWLLALPAMPRQFKFLIALVVDNYGSERIGRRKSWIIPCTVLGAGFYALLGLIPPHLENVNLIVGILVVSAFVMAAQDIAVDGYAAESMNDAERPTGVSIINVLVAVGSTLAIASIALVEVLGWPITMVAAAALLVLAATPAMFRKEPPAPQAVQVRMQRGEGPSLIRALKRKESREILPYIFLFGFGQNFLLAMLGPFWADKGMSTIDYGILAPCAAIAGGILAATTTPWLIARTSMRVTALIGLAALPIETYVYITFNNMTELPPLYVIIGFVAFLSWTTSLYVYCGTISRFRWVSKAQAGTDYSLQSSFWNLGLWAAGSTAGFVAGGWGYDVFFIVATLCALVGGTYYVTRWAAIEAKVSEREHEEISA